MAASSAKLSNDRRTLVRGRIAHHAPLRSGVAFRDVPNALFLPSASRPFGERLILNAARDPNVTPA